MCGIHSVCASLMSSSGYIFVHLPCYREEPFSQSLITLGETSMQPRRLRKGSRIQPGERVRDAAVR